MRYFAQPEIEPPPTKPKHPVRMGDLDKALSPKIDDVPDDDKLYIRRNGVWVEVGDCKYPAIAQKRKFVADGESTRYVIPHDLGTEDIIASAYNDATGEKIIPKETANFQDYLLLETTTPIPEGMTVRVVMIGVNPEWTNKPKGSGIVGDIRLLPFRATELPFGWYYPSGDYFDIGSDVGKALNAFSDNYKFDWGIESLDETIRLFDPGKFFTADHGRFFRPVNGISRAPGSTEDDAIRNIKSTSYLDARHANTSPIFDAGPLYYSGATPYGGSVSKLSYDVGYCLWFDASRVVPTADENRPYNVGLTPAVYLGV